MGFWKREKIKRLNARITELMVESSGYQQDAVQLAASTIDRGERIVDLERNRDILVPMYKEALRRIEELEAEIKAK